MQDSVTASAFPRRRRRSGFGRLARHWLTLPLVLWALLWLSINTGPWNLAHAGSGDFFGTLNAVRVAFPLLALVAAVLALLSRRSQHRPTLAESGLWFYALFMLVSSLQIADSWFFYGYWALAFLASLAVVQLGLSGRKPLEFAQRLNVMSWLTALLVLITLLVFAREALFASHDALSAYGIQNRVSSIGETPMSRPSGLSRMAAVPAIVALVYVFRGRWLQRGLAVAVFVGAFGVIWIMQSRGSLFAFLGAFAFVLLLGDRTARRFGIVAILLLATFWLGDVLSGGVLHELWQHATRSTGFEGFGSMSGRTRIWGEAWDHIREAPVLGHGPRGDRRVMGGDAQNALVYAMLNAGFVGTICFVAAMAGAWASLIRLLGERGALARQHRTMVTVSGGLLVFFTLRSVPENTAAFFSIDLLLQYPAMVYLAVLSRKVRSARSRWPAGRPLRAGFA